MTPDESTRLIELIESMIERPKKPTPFYGKPCSNCGATDEECIAAMNLTGPRQAPCCSTCKRTATHGQDHPGYLHPSEPMPEPEPAREYVMVRTDDLRRVLLGFRSARRVIGYVLNPLEARSLHAVVTSYVEATGEPVEKDPSP